MKMELLLFQPLCEKDEEGTAGEPWAYAVIRESAEPYGLQCPYKYPTIEDLCEHIIAQLHKDESFDLEALRAALSKKKIYAVLVETNLAHRIASHPL
jgi:hypothetical protein